MDGAVVAFEAVCGVLAVALGGAGACGCEGAGAEVGGVGFVGDFHEDVEEVVACEGDFAAGV